MPQAATTCTTVEELAVECTHCGVRMSSHLGSSQQVRYFHCPSCSRWTTSMYKELLRADSKMRSRRSSEVQAGGALGSVKERLESWLQSLSGSDPYQALGLPPGVSDSVLRERYVALARTHHPDKGGSADEMRRINEAYEKVLAHREQRRAVHRHTALPVGVP